MGRQKTHEEFKEEVYSLVNDEYTLLEEYKGAKSKIKIRHNICGHIYKVRPDAFLKGSRCPECRVKAITKTHKQFVEDVYQAVGEEYTVIGEYINSKKKIRMKHNICDNEWDVYPCSFLSNEKRCPYCSGLMRKTPEEFKKEVFELVGNEYAVLSDYKNNHTKVKMRHEKCGYEWRAVPTNFLRGSRCPRCAGSMKITSKQFKDKIFELVEDEYTVLEDYKNSYTKVKMKHNTCGHEWEVYPSNFLRGTRCPKCIHSKGEDKIEKYLIEKDIKYETQKTFKDLKHFRPLKFDFYLPEYDLLVEYDGKQHYEPVDYGIMSYEQAKKEHTKVLKRDSIKNKYCKENNIELLRIPYTDFNNIEEKLDECFLKPAGTLFRAEPNVNVSGTWK